MTLNEKIDFTKTSTETYLKRIRCCSWVFLVTAVWFVGNSLYCFHETREWAHFISASGGKLPWPTPKEEYADIMRSTRDDQPTEAEFALYNALMLTAGAMLVMGLVFFRQSKMARRAAWKQKERPVARKVFGSLICLGLFFACYGVSKYSCGEVKHIAEVLQNNGTIEAPPMMQPRDHEHRHGEHHGHHDRHLEEWDGESADWEAEEFDHPRHEGHHGDHHGHGHKHHKKHGCTGLGMCPVMLFLIIAQLFHLYNLHSLKKCYENIRVFKKAQEVAKNKASASDTERSEE